MASPTQLTANRENAQALSSALWNDMRPNGPIQEMFTTEVVRAAWRLRGCAEVEATLADETTSDPMLDTGLLRTQIAVDRARSQSHGVIRRSLAEIAKTKNPKPQQNEPNPRHRNPPRQAYKSAETPLVPVTPDKNTSVAAAKTPPPFSITPPDRVEMGSLFQTGKPDSEGSKLTGKPIANGGSENSGWKNECKSGEGKPADCPEERGLSR
jgi:hypothetical protein